MIILITSIFLLPLILPSHSHSTHSLPLSLDLDAVCGLARGHGGWGGPHCILPPCLSDAHSTPARLRSQVDPYFDLYRGALVALSPQSDNIGSLASDGPQGDGGGMGCTEWLAVLRALMQKTLSAGLSDFAVAVSVLDECTENSIDPNLKDILAGTSSIHSLVRHHTMSLTYVTPLFHPISPTYITLLCHCGIR